MLPRKRLLVPGTLAAALVVAAITGCAPTVALDPASNATDPGCAEVMVRLPTTVAEQPSRETNAQATAAWGSPAAVLLRCGVGEFGPTTLPCLDINGIQWIEDDSQKPSYTYTTFGRSPATQVIVDSNAVSASTALIDLQTAVASIQQTNVCLNPENVIDTSGAGGSSATPAPTTGAGTPTDGAGTPTGGTDSPTDTSTAPPTGEPFIVSTTPPAPVG